MNRKKWPDKPPPKLSPEVAPKNCEKWEKWMGKEDLSVRLFLKVPGFTFRSVKLASSVLVWDDILQAYSFGLLTGCKAEVNWNGNRGNSQKSGPTFHVLWEIWLASMLFYDFMLQFSLFVVEVCRFFESFEVSRVKKSTLRSDFDRCFSSLWSMFVMFVSSWSGWMFLSHEMMFL